ncbi:MAG: hypothetical protein MUC72_10580 [Acidobacteria bacterium]|nr:hypothetical protein [Acidobacteriota bacterium]
MKERKRRKALNKVSGEFRDKEKAHADQLVALGQKAWDTRTDISAYADLKAALGDTQKALDDLRGQAEQLQKQKQESEAKKKQENERLNAAQKDIDSQKRKEDGRLSEKKNALQGDQKESQRALSRLAAIVRERSQLQNKGSNPVATDAEKKEIAGGLDLLAREEEELKSANEAREAAGRPLTAAIAATQEESARLQKLIDDLRQEQKKVNSELDRQIAALAADLARINEKTREADARQKLQFRDLGDRLAAAQGVAPDIAKEMAAVLNARTEMQGVQSLIGGLERQKDEGQASAYKKMRAIIIAAVVLLAALAVALILLLSPGKKPTPLEALLENSGEAAQQLGQIASQLEKKIGDQAALAKAEGVSPEAGNAIVDEILAAFDQCVAEAAALARDKPEAAVLLPQLEKLYAGYSVKMAALNTRFLALRDRDIFAFRRANGHMSSNRPKHVYAKDTALSQTIAYYNFEKGEQAVVDMLANKIVKLLDEAVKQ